MDPNSNIARWVAFLIAPVVLFISTLLVTKAKAWFAVDVDPDEAKVVVGGIALALVTWLYNRGRWEVAKVVHLEGGAPPAIPPGEDPTTGLSPEELEPAPEELEPAEEPQPENLEGEDFPEGEEPQEEISAGPEAPTSSQPASRRNAL